MATAMERFSALKSKVSDLGAKKQFWAGKKESHEATKKKVLATAAELGYKETSLTELKATLEKEIESDLLKLETDVAEVESKFDKLTKE